MADVAKTSKLANIRKKTFRFFKDIRSELKKVIWPTRVQLTKSTITVLLTCLTMGIIIWVSDAILAKVLGWTLAR